MQLRVFAGLAAALLLAGGCADVGTATDTSASGSTPPASATITATPTTSVTATDVPTGGGSSSCVEDAVIDAAAASLPTFFEVGWEVYEKGDPCATLSWALAQPKGPTGASPYHVLFFHDNTYLGTATAESYSFTDVVSQTDDTVTASYKWLRDGESTAGVSGGPALIRYQWNGSSVDMLDQLPPEVADREGYRDPPPSDSAPVPTSPASTTPVPAPGGRCADRAAAIATASKLDGGSWRVWSQESDLCKTLVWFLMEPASDTSADAPVQVLFFHDGTYVGSANDRAYPNVRITDVTDSSLSLTYGWRVPGDEEWNPGGVSDPVTYRWNGATVETQGTLPVEVTG